MSTLSTLKDALTDLYRSADDFASQSVQGIPALAPEVAYAVHNFDTLPEPVAEAWSAITSAAERLEDSREKVIDVGEEARIAIRDYETALVSGASDPALLPKEVPNLDRYRIAIDAEGVVFETARRDLVAAHLAANVHAPSLRSAVITYARKAFLASVRSYLGVASVFTEALTAMENAERTALSFDPVLASRLDVISRHVQDVGYIYKARESLKHAAANVGAATFGANALTLLTGDEWLTGDAALRFRAEVTVPALPTEAAPVHDDEPEVETVGDVEASLAEDLDLAPKPRARRKVTEDVTA